MAKTTKRADAHQGNVTSVGDVRANRTVDALAPAFVQWPVRERGVQAEVAVELFGSIRVLVGAYLHASPSPEATNFEPIPFGKAIADDLGTFCEDQETEVSFAFDAIHFFMEFLGERDSWTGSNEDYNTIDDYFHMDENPSLPVFVTPQVSADEALVALSGTELARLLERLLGWTGDGRMVTSTGALRLKEIESAAAAVGVSAKGSTPHATRAKAPTVDIEPVSLESVPTVKPMYEVSLLAKFGAALEAFHDEGGSVPGPGGQPLPSRKPQPKASLPRRKKSSPAQILQLRRPSPERGGGGCW